MCTLWSMSSLFCTVFHHHLRFNHNKPKWGHVLLCCLQCLFTVRLSLFSDIHFLIAVRGIRSSSSLLSRITILHPVLFICLANVARLLWRVKEFVEASPPLWKSGAGARWFLKNGLYFLNEKIYRFHIRRT